MKDVINYVINHLDYLLSLASVFICFILSLIINIKKIKSLKSKNKDISNNEVINNLLLEFIEDAESFKNYSGVEKKEYVLTKINRYLLDNNINFDVNKISEKIEELIKLTNNVNIKKEISSNKYISKLTED